MAPTIRIGRESWCLPYAGFFFSQLGEYSTDLYSGEAVQRIKEHNGSEPLFLYVAFQVPVKPAMSD